MISLAAKLARKAGRKKLASRLARLASALSPGSAGALAEYCADRMAARDFESIAARCAAAASRPRPSEALKEAATSWLVRSRIEDDVDAALLGRLMPAFRARAAAAAERFADRDPAGTQDRLAEALKLAGAPVPAIPEWLAAFNAIGGIGEARPSDPSAAGDGEPGVPARPRRKIVVSGMYWSGSGALYDFFREFDDIVPVAGELRLWKEGDFCLPAVESALGEGGPYRDRLYAFLTKALAGIAPIGAWKDELASRYALSWLRSDRDGGYARACRRFAEAAAPMDLRGSAAVPAFDSIASRLSDELCDRWSRGREGTILLDNVVHIGRIGALRLLGDAIVLCSFRDPRSNFVARWRENPRFNRDAGRYVEYYRETMRGFESELAASPALAARVRRVSFERFILSEPYRDGLAAECGLDLSARRRGSRFRPDASRRNIENYGGFEDPEAIRLIERELAEYCVDEASLRA